MIDAIFEIGEDNTFVPFEGNVSVLWQFDQRMVAAKMPDFKLHKRYAADLSARQGETEG